jgi:hypothetical protein
LFGFVPVKVKGHGPGLDQRRILKWSYTPPNHPPPPPPPNKLVYNLNLGIGKYLKDLIKTPTPQPKALVLK